MPQATDAELTAQIEDIEKRMHEASESEDFATAKKLKAEVEPLRVARGQLRYKQSGRAEKAERAAEKIASMPEIERLPSKELQAILDKEEDAHKKIENLEKRMHDATEMEDFDAAARLKQKLDALRQELTQLEVVHAAQQEEDDILAEERRPLEGIKGVSERFGKPSPHDKMEAATIVEHFGHASKHDKEVTGALSDLTPSAHDKHVAATIATGEATAHDRAQIATFDHASAHDKNQIATYDHASAHDKNQITVHDKPNAHDREQMHVPAHPTAKDMHILNPPASPPPPPKPRPPPNADIESAKTAAEEQQENLVLDVLTQHQSATPREPTKEPPEHPCKCGSSKATWTFLFLVQGVVVPALLIVLAIVLAPGSNPLSDSSATSISDWWPYLLTIPAFIDIMVVTLYVLRERGPGGSLESGLFAC